MKNYKAKAPKYGNEKVKKLIENKVVTFDSRKEAKRWEELYMLEKAKKIQNLELQPKYVLSPMQKHNGKTYRGVTYSADFRYIENGKTVVEDVKSEATKKDKTYIVKVKWFLSLYGNILDFREVI